MSKYEKEFKDYWLRIMNGDFSHYCNRHEARYVAKEMKEELRYLLRKLKMSVQPLKYAGVDAHPIYINYTEAYALMALLIGEVGEAT